MFGYTLVNDEPTAPAPVPEPATWILVGAGVAVLRKKFKKK
jgi:hypothetical protein